MLHQLRDSTLRCSAVMEEGWFAGKAEYEGL